MKESIYIARATVERIAGVHRRAHLELGPALDFGVHGPIREHYRIETDADRPLPVDYVVAATGT